MNIKFHRVILSTDDRPETLEFWPFVASAWNTWYPEISIELAYVTNKSFDDPEVKHMAKFGNIHMFRPTDSNPTAINFLIQMCKFILPCMIGDGSICLISNINTFPMNREGYHKATDPIENGRVLVLNNNEVVVNSDYLRKILNPNNLSAGKLIKSWEKYINNFNIENFFQDHRENGSKLNPTSPEYRVVDMTKPSQFQISKLWAHEYDKGIFPLVPFSKIQTNIKHIADYTGHCAVSFEGVDKNPKPHWVGVKKPDGKSAVNE